MSETTEHELPAGWGPLEPGQARAFTRQLRYELGPDDPLIPWFEKGAIRAIGGSVSSDDVVFAIEDWEAPYFVSHLSWTRQDKRPALIRYFNPRPRPDPGVVPLSSLFELHGWTD